MRRKLSLLVVLIFISLTLSASAKVLSFTGKVKVKPEPSSSWQRVKVGDEIPNNAMVSTGFNSNLVLELDNSTLEVLPLTRMKVSELKPSQDRISTELFLQGGKIKADVKRTAGLINDFTIKSPVATASVRGTSFEFSGNKLTVLEGVVAFGSPDRQLDEGEVEEKQGTLVAVQAGGSSQLATLDGKPVDPVLMAKAKSRVIVSTKPEIVKEITLETIEGTTLLESIPSVGDIQKAIEGGETTITIKFNW